MKLTTFIQYCLPQHGLSRMLGKLYNSEKPFIKNTLIRMFIAYFKVNMDEVDFSKPEDYPTFNAFFTRHLKKDARPIANEIDAIASPSDGTIAQIGIAKQEVLLQAKGHYFSLESLLGGDEETAQLFLNGHYATIYLGPRDYHRVHMPIDGTLKQMIFIPGKLFSVNNDTVNDVSHLFARNERVVCIFDTMIGPMAVILVGAIFVGSMAVAWEGIITPNRYNQTTVWSYENKPAIHLKRGQELGYFLTGSTVIVLFGNNRVEWSSHLPENTVVKMGQNIGKILNAK